MVTLFHDEGSSLSDFCSLAQCSACVIFIIYAIALCILSRWPLIPEVALLSEWPLASGRSKESTDWGAWFLLLFHTFTILTCFTFFSSLSLDVSFMVNCFCVHCIYWHCQFLLSSSQMRIDLEATQQRLAVFSLHLYYFHRGVSVIMHGILYHVFTTAWSNISLVPKALLPKSSWASLYCDFVPSLTPVLFLLLFIAELVFLYVSLDKWSLFVEKSSPTCMIHKQWTVTCDQDCLYSFVSICTPVMIFSAWFLTDSLPTGTCAWCRPQIMPLSPWRFPIFSSNSLHSYGIITLL